MKPAPVALFGGAFDPPHVGHRALARAALALPAIREVWVLPAHPVHRDLSGCASDAQRQDWLARMFAGDRGIQIVDWELRAGSRVPAIVTLRRFVAERSAVPWLLLGADAWQGLERWVDYPEHRAVCNALVCTRRGVDEPRLLDGWTAVEAGEMDALEGPGHVVMLRAGLPEVSATEIRRRAAEGERITGLVPAEIEQEVAAAYACGKERR